MEGQSSRSVRDTSFLIEYGAIEALRAARFRSVFSLALVDVGEESADEIETVAGRISAAVRACDVVGMLDGSVVAALLPETDFFGALTAAKKLAAACPMGSTVTHSSFPGDGATIWALIDAARRRMGERAASLWETCAFRDKLYWEIVGELLNEVYRGTMNASFDAGEGHETTASAAAGISRVAVAETLKTPQKKSLIYSTARSFAQDAPLIRTLASSAPASARIFLIGDSSCEEEAREVKNATPICLDDARLKETQFTFCLSEDSAYALICREAWGGAYSCFHSADPFLVEGLISKFQKEYSLQGLFV